MTIGIIGTRQRDTDADLRLAVAAFKRVFRRGDDLVSGGCSKGGDRFAEEIACDWIDGKANYAYDIPIRIHYPDKSKLDEALPFRAAYREIAYARNLLIARDADVLIAVVAPDRRGGTEHTIQAFCKKFVKTEAQLVAEGKLVLV